MPRLARFRTEEGLEHARGVLATALPPALVARTDLASLALRPGSFVDEDLRDRTSDILYAARISGREALIYFLLEHKSDPEDLTPLQVLRYMLKIWTSTSPRSPRRSGARPASSP